MRSSTFDLDPKLPLVESSTYSSEIGWVVKDEPKIEYPGHYEVRQVSRNGGVRWNSKWVCVSHVLGEEYVGFDEVDDGLWEVFYGPVRLGRFNERDSKIEDDRGRKYRKNMLPIVSGLKCYLSVRPFSTLYFQC